jgi:segregation and condensation protein B
MAKRETKKVIESILLVADKPVSAKELAGVCGAMYSDVQKIMVELIDEYKNRGIKVLRKGDYYSLVTDPDSAESVARFLNEELRHDISDAALEALSIITYKQPVTRIDIEEIRGVASDQLLRNLLIRGLIQEVGRKDTPGRPILYGTTMEFLQYFGLKDESELPEFKIPEAPAELFQDQVDTISSAEE